MSNSHCYLLDACFSEIAPLVLPGQIAEALYMRVQSLCSCNMLCTCVVYGTKSVIIFMCHHVCRSDRSVSLPFILCTGGSIFPLNLRERGSYSPDNHNLYDEQGQYRS